MTEFERHYSDFFDYVYRYVFVRLKSPEATEDLVSKVFLSAFEKQTQYDPEKGSWKQWITGIARNAVFRHWQSNTTHLDLDELSLIDIHLERFKDQKEHQDQELEFKRIMDSVTPDARMLLILRYEEDLTYEDIADILNKTPAAVRKTFSRLHQQLSAQFKDFID